MATNPPNPQAKGATGPTAQAKRSPNTTAATGPIQGRKNTQQETVAPTGATGPSLIDSGYLNTSLPKNYPVIDQPSGTYKPLSEVSRFIFDASDTAGPGSYSVTNRDSDLRDGLEQQGDGSYKYKQTNRKYFGANLAVVNKLENVEWTNSYEKVDYIAYLIPYGTPGVALKSAQVISTEVPQSAKESPSQNAPSETIDGAKKLADQNKVGFELFITSTIISFWPNLPPNAIDTDAKKITKLNELRNGAISDWNAQASIKAIDVIISVIESTYGTNYQSKESLIKTLRALDNRLLEKPTDYITIKSKLEKDGKSLAKVIESAPPVSYATSNFKIPANQGFTLPAVGPNNPTFSTTVLQLSDTAKDPKNFKKVFGFSADPRSSQDESADAGIIGVDPSLKIWQFLYNPQSITIDVKADYAESNTWGATDDGQSGRSVQWLRNQNPVMRLDEVVLNGFIHGKKVSQLEEGLFALLMSRNGPGQIEPTVWEFVWGKRRFGPCVINNIQVVERQWEAGEVLSATVSFELTQIPKWQIIDKTVKFYDPTALGTFAEPPSGGGDVGASGPGAGTTTPSDSAQGRNAPGGGGTNDPCRTLFNSTIDSAKSKSLSSYLFSCSKKTNPPIDLYAQVTEKNIDNILDALDKQCNSFNGGKTPIISTDAQGREYKAQGKATLLAAVREKQNCINKNSLKEKPVSASTANNLLNYAYEIINYQAFSFGNILNVSNSPFIQNYDSLYKQVSNNFKIDDLAKRIDTNISILNFEIPQTSNPIPWKTSAKERKCRTKTISDKFLGSRNDRFRSEISTCAQQIWLVILQEMARQKLNIKSDAKTSTNADFFIKVLTSNGRPKEIEFTRGGGFKTGAFVGTFALPSLKAEF